MKRKLFALLVIGQVALLLPSCGRLACADLQTAQDASWRIKIGKFQGSGTAISPKLVATAFHLADHVGETATLWRPGTVDQQVTGKVVSVGDMAKDVSLIQLDGETTKYVQCGNDPAKGQHITSCGYGHNEIGCSSQGNVTGDYSRFCYEGSILVESGDSGGGIFDDSGNLVGVISGTNQKPPPGQITKGPLIAVRVSYVKQLAAKPSTGAGPLKKLRLLFFHASWCSPCRKMEPTVQQLAGEGLEIESVDYDRDRDAVSHYGISGIPCFVAVDDEGNELGRITGACDRGSLENLCRWQQQQNDANQRQPWSQPPQNPQGMQPLQPNSSRDDQQDQKIAAIEGWIGNANGVANPILNRFGKPSLPPLAQSGGSPQVPAQPQAPPPIPAAPAPSNELPLIDAAKQAMADQVAEIKSQIDNAKAEIQSKIPGAPAIGAAAKPFIDQAITAAIPIIIEKAGPIINAAAPGLLAQFGPPGAIAALLLGGFTMLWRKKSGAPPASSASDIASVLKPIVDAIESKLDVPAVVKPMFDIFGSQIVGAINNLGAKMPLPVQLPQANSPSGDSGFVVPTATVVQHHNRYVPVESHIIDKAWLQAAEKIAERWPAAAQYFAKAEKAKNDILSAQPSST